MKKSADTPPQCALNPQDAAGNNSHHRQGKDDRNHLANRGSGRNPHRLQGQLKREPQRMSQPWSNPTFDNSNTSWEGDWSGTPPIKNDSTSGVFYKHSRNPTSYQSGSEWSPGESSASNSVPSSYGMMQSPSNNSLSASYYENNGFYGSGYNNYGQGGYAQPSYGQQQQYQQPVRTGDGYNSNRNPSSCQPASAKQPVPDYHRRQNRYGLEGMPRVQIKQELEDYPEMEGDNFTSLFTKSLTSLYSQDTENAFPEEGKPYDPDIMICTPLPAPAVEDQSGYQRLHSSSGQYNTNASGDYQDGRSNFGFYDTRIPNCDPPSNIVQEIGSKGDRMNSFRYDRPSFDDMHLYASNPTDSKTQAKKRKLSMPTTTPESNFTENRKKTPRLLSFKSESQWTPNSFGFGENSIKQEPIDDYTTNELDTQKTVKDSSLGSNGNGSSKTPEQQKDQPKQPPRKRSPGSTCFDRFDKKSTPTNKKVSPLSVYAKVQESIVLTVKCRRYKKRTKPITSKEEAMCPGKEEMENYKRSTLTPDQAARQVMNELLERVSLFGERSVIDGPDLTQMDAFKVRELLMQFCHRFNLDYRDFEDISSVLKPRIVKDKMAKNSVRASAIRKRTSTSPVHANIKPPPVQAELELSSVQAKVESEPVSRTPRGRKKANNENSTPSEKRVLRQLPGRVDRGRTRHRRSSSSSKTPVTQRRYSTRSAKDVEEARDSEDDIIIDSSTDREGEAGKEAEVRKKSQRLRNKQPVAKTLVRERSSEKNKQPLAKMLTRERSSEKSKPVVKMPGRERSLEKASKSIKPNKTDVEETGRRTRSREKRVEKPKQSPKPVLRNRRSLHRRISSRDSLRSSSVEIVDITRSSDSASPPLLEEIKTELPSSFRALEKVKDSVKNELSSPFKPKEKAKSKNLLKTSKKIKIKNTTEMDQPSSPLKSAEKIGKKEAVKIDSSSPLKLAENTKNTDTIEIKPSSTFTSVETTNNKDIIKKDSSLLFKSAEKAKGKDIKPMVETEVTTSQRTADKRPISPTYKRFLKHKFEKNPLINSSVKSGSSKRKQGGPTKYLKESAKDTIVEMFLESNSSTENPESTSDSNSKDQQNSKKYFTSNLLSEFNHSKLFKLGDKKSIVALSKSDNSPQLLRERYRKSFCVESSTLPNTTSKEFEGKAMKINSLPKLNNSTKFLKERFKKCAVLDLKQNYLKEQDSTMAKPEQNNSDKSFSNSLKKRNHSCNASSSFITKIKEELLSEEDIPNNINHEQSPSKLPTVSKAVIDVKTEKLPAKVFRHLSNKKLPRRRSSQCSESELQVVLTKLPDVQVNLQNGSVAVEVVRMCEEEQKRMASAVKLQEKGSSEEDSDEEKPPELVSMKDLTLERTEGTRERYSEDNCKHEQGIKLPDISAESRNTSRNSTSETIQIENLRAVDCRRYSESEDSDCGLVIDLDRRQSVEERVPSPTLQNSSTDERIVEAKDTDKPQITVPDESPITIADELPITNSDESVITNSDEPVIPGSDESLITISDEPSITVSDKPLIIISDESRTTIQKEKPIPSTSSETKNSNYFHDATEEAHILLQLSRGGMPPLVQEVAKPSTSNWTPSMSSSTEISGDEHSQAETGGSTKRAMEVREPERDESILRTLLLETGDTVPGTSQDVMSEPQPGPSTISTEPKPTLNQEVMRLLLYQAYQAVSPSSSTVGFDDKKILDQLQISPDQLPTDINANFLPESYEWNLRDPQAIREEIKKLKNEIRYLQCMADQKDRERTSIVCFKRYKEEVLKRLLKKYTYNVNDHVRDWVEQKPEQRNRLNFRQPIASTSSNGIHSRLSIALAYRNTVKTDGPSATVTSSDSYSSNSVENLPTVATMVANATENYGVDLRTVTSRNAVSTTKTILQEVLSSRESIYSPVAPGSPLSSDQRTGESVQIFQKTTSTTRQSTFTPNRSRSPSLPEQSPKSSRTTPHFSKKVFSSSSSQSPPSLQPELVQTPFTPTASSSFQNHYPLSLVVTSSESETTKTIKVTTSSSTFRHGTPKSSPRSSPESSSGNSFSVWSHVKAERSSPLSSTSIDLRTNRVSSKAHQASKRSTSVGMTNGHSSFMVVPPPTTLSSSSKHKGHHRSRSEARPEKLLTGKVERIYERKNEDGPQTHSSHTNGSRFVPYTGPLTSIAPTLNYPPRCMGCGMAGPSFVCSGCGRHWYCSPECQTMRWPEHSKTCSGTHLKENSKSSYK